jgi:hypothetical protein
MLASMARLGILPGKSFEISKLDPTVQAALKDIPQTALKKLEGNAGSLGAIVNGWIVSKGLGTYGPNDYLKRTTVAALGWPRTTRKMRSIPTPRLTRLARSSPARTSIP